MSNFIMFISPITTDNKKAFQLSERLFVLRIVSNIYNLLNKLTYCIFVKDFKTIQLL